MTCDALTWIVQSLQENDMAASIKPPKLPNLREINMSGKFLQHFLCISLYCLFIGLIVFNFKAMV